jgi:3-methyladenine DNA glycosylase AlkD
VTRGAAAEGSETTRRATAFVAGHVTAADALGVSLVHEIDRPEAFAASLCDGLARLADPEYLAGQRLVAPGIGPTHGVRGPLLRRVGAAFRRRTRTARPAELLQLADRLLREELLEARWFAFGLLERTVRPDPERTWQLIRRAARDAADWITVDTLAGVTAVGVLSEPYRWAELEQLVFSPSRWERRLVGSTIANLPYADRLAGRQPTIATRGLEVLGQLIGDHEPDVRKALSWAYRSLSIVDPAAVAAALRREATLAARTADGHRAWVVRDALQRLDPGEAARIREAVGGIRTRPASPSTSRAAATAARFAGLGLGRHLPEPPLI